MKATRSKIFWAAVTVEKDFKYYAYVIPFSENDNALYKLTVPGVLHANIFGTRKAAKEVVESWNASYRANKIYLFDTPNF